MLHQAAFGIINQARQSDLEQEEARVQADRDARKVLRIQAGNGALLTSGDLVKRLAGADGDEVEAKDEPLRIQTEEAPDVTAQPAFPPPPKAGDPSKAG